MNLGPLVNTTANESVPSLSRDGHWLFIKSTRPGGLGSVDIWASYRFDKHDDFGWQPSVNLGPGVNSAFSEQGASLLENDNDGRPLLYFGSDRPGGMGGSDIYVSEQMPDGSFGPAILVPQLSSPNNDQRPVPRFDGLELFLFSDRPGSLGATDIWVSTRESVHDSWSTPVNVGAPVNSEFNDAQAYLASDRRDPLLRIESSRRFWRLRPLRDDPNENAGAVDRQKANVSRSAGITAAETKRAWAGRRGARGPRSAGRNVAAPAMGRR